MKITLYSGPLFLLAVLAMPWVGAAPLVAASEDEVNNALHEFLDKNPSVATDLYPKLVNAANYVTLILDQEVVTDLLNNYMRDAAANEEVEELAKGEEEGDELEEDEEERTREKRQTSISGTINGASNPL